MLDILTDTKARLDKLDLEEGDTLVVTVPEKLSAEKRMQYVQLMRRSLPAGVKCLIIDGGTTLERLKREHEAKVDSAAYRDAFGPKVERPGKVAWWQRWMRKDA
ncbi:hypothetical protein [Noviherbaspirillum suwonense]|uniref:TubC N-terminal docking domain-containing protein n=1 Tax=Noviherbaspirillum suwonense TaxID=1224511 RepID=A0ABY1QIF0_9BURK|nr:hypothetical protein [Noviherbaspirillum suwonense]SMP71883.1 hypothetical protein SAMN06295970_11783 [Noviherbaspirillum suwonense]